MTGAGTVGYAVVDNSILAPDDSATNYTQNTAGTLDATLAGTTVGTKYDQLNVTQAATLAARSTSAWD